MDMLTALTCPHACSLIYFETVNGSVRSWEICDSCSERFNEQSPKSDEELRKEEQLAEWLKNYHYNAGSRDT